MKKIIRKLKRINKLISETQKEIDVVETLPFYSIFSNNESKEAELNCLRLALRDYLNVKFSILENLERALKYEKSFVSKKQQQNNLKKIG